MSETFSYKNYSIVASLNERSIYLKVIDTVNFLSYEGNVDLKELRVSIDLEGAYKIIINCFKEESNFAVTISVNSGVLKLAFNALIGGFLKMNFEVLLREKIMSNDGQLTLNFNKLEQQQAMAIKSLTEKCNNLEGVLAKQQREFAQQIEFLRGIINGVDIFTSPSHHWSAVHQTQFTANIASTELTLSGDGNFNAKSIASFYQLEKLTINGFISQTNLNNVKNIKLKELILNCGNATFTSLDGMANFPNLEILTITSASGLTNVVAILKETKHKIKTLKFQACAAVNVVELQTYCQVNNVFLALS
jgi:hypothetical protein